MSPSGSLAAMLGLPLIAMTAYLLWVWPAPKGTSLWAEVGPYVLSLLTGLPFAAILSRRPGMIWVLPVFLGAGFVILWIYAAAVLCGVRGVCL